jgi:hypothetical protein
MRTRTWDATWVLCAAAAIACVAGCSTSDQSAGSGAPDDGGADASSTPAGPDAHPQGGGDAGAGGGDAGQSGGDAGTAAGPCAGTSVFCDDYTSASLAGAYHTVNGTWTRQSGVYVATDSIAWERARAVLAGDYADFDVTIHASSLGDAGFGLVYAASDDTHGYAVLVHPAQFQGVYLKELVPGSQDVAIKSAPLPANEAGTPLVLRVQRSGSTVTVWLGGVQQFTADDGGAGAHGQLGLLTSTTDQTANSGADFTLLRLDTASSPPADAGPPPPADSGATGPLPAICNGRTVIFRDDFNGTALDTTKWNTAYAFCGSGCCSLPSNGEQECYVPGQVQVHDGALHLVGAPVQGASLPYASGMISSGGSNGSASKWDFQYGYFEARVKIPSGQGLWPAFWTGNSDGSWPPEIDVMEILGNAPATWYGTVHYSTPSNNNNGDGTSWTGPDFSQDWHSFGVDWQPGLLVWYIDGVERKRVTTAIEVQSKRAFLMANLAVGGGWPGNPNSSTPFPADYQVDWILVCQ